jgi:hypothetical protein
LDRKAEFDVVLRYSAPCSEGKSKGETMSGTITAKSEDTFGGNLEVKLGKVSPEAGPVLVEVSADTITGKELMRLKILTLTLQ